MPDPGFSGTASFTYTVCDDGTTAGEADPQCAADGHGDDQHRRAEPTAGRGSGRDRDRRGHRDPGDADGQRSRRRSADVRHLRARQRHAVRHRRPISSTRRAPTSSATDTFTFTVSDGQATSLPATVTVDGQRGQRPGVGRSRQHAGARTPAHRRSARRRCSPTTCPAPRTRPRRRWPSPPPTAGPDTHGTVALGARHDHLHPRRGVRRTGFVHLHRRATTGRPPVSPIRCASTVSWR